MYTSTIFTSSTIETTLSFVTITPSFISTSTIEVNQFTSSNTDFFLSELTTEFKITTESTLFNTIISSNATNEITFLTESATNKVTNLPSTSTTHATTKTSSNQINSFFSAFFGNVTFVLSLLSGVNYDISGCLQNCSMQGYCLPNPITMQYSCTCVDFKTGLGCSSDSRPCFSSPCMNSGFCSDFSILSNQTQLNTTADYTCECIYPYYGSQCQNKINLCQNVTCSGNGVCQDLGNSTGCKCFTGYNGDLCDLESSELKTIKTVISTTTVVTYVTIGVFILMILCIDYTSYRQGKFILRGKRNEQNRLIRSQKNRKPEYVNWPK